MNIRLRRGRVPVHPLLFALYAPLALTASNILQVRLSDTLRSWLVFLLLGSAIYGIARVLCRDWQKAALYASVLIVLFVSYGQVLTPLKKVVWLGEVIGRHRYLAPLFLLLGALAMRQVSRLRDNLGRVTRTVNIIALLLILFPILQLAATAVMTSINQDRNERSVTGLAAGAGLGAEIKPDVYYIILDMYGRDDILLKRYFYDNSAFLQQLEDLGFTVTRCSVSNYSMTELSLASSFNMNYLQVLGDQYTYGHHDRSGLPSLIHHSAVRKIFQDMGYRFINFESGFTFTEIRDADEYLVPSYVDVENRTNPFPVNAFESLLIHTTAFSILSDAQTKLFSPVVDALDLRRKHVVRQLYLLDTLPKLASEPGPKFVYAHVLIPHPPFVFSSQGVNLELPESYGPDGKGPNEHDYSVGYRNQLDYIQMRLIPILQRIQQDSATPPIIIIQGDHGVDPQRSFILNAYYLPGLDHSPIWPSISPVNTFRVILNAYFHGHYELLPDINYDTNDDAPFDYQVVMNERDCPR